MYLIAEWLRTVFLYRRVVLHLSNGRRITYRRPKETSVRDYRALILSWLVLDRVHQKLGDDKHGVIARSEDVVAVEVY